MSHTLYFCLGFAVGVGVTVAVWLYTYGAGGDPE